jgi:hypothetical protein
MRRGTYGSAAAPTPQERALLLQVTALQFEKSSMSLELKTLKDQQETFLQEVEIEIEAQKSEGLAAAAAEIQNLQLQRRQAAEAAAKEINQLQLQLKLAKDELKNREEAFACKLPSHQPHNALQTSNGMMCGDIRLSEEFVELEMRLAVALEANISMTHANMQLRKELDETLSATRHQAAMSTSGPALSVVSSQVVFDYNHVAVQTSASDSVSAVETTSQITAELLSRIRVENFRQIILRNFCCRIASASSHRTFRRWKCFVKEHVHRTLQKTLEAELSELTDMHRTQQMQLNTFQASDQRAMSSLWRCRERIGNSKIFASSRKVLRFMWKCWLKRIRIRRRVQTYSWRNIKKCFNSWATLIRHQRTLQRSFLNCMQRKQRVHLQKTMSSWKHEALISHIINQQHEVQHAAEKFVTMHEAQNDAVSAIKQTCAQMMSDLESVTSERNRFLSLFLSCEGKLVAYVCFSRANSTRRYLFQIWKRKIANRKNVIRIEKRSTIDFLKRTFLLWYFDSKIRMLNDFHERQISESIENLELERETTGSALQNTEDQLAETLIHLDEAMLEIEHLLQINNELKVIKNQSSSQDCGAQTNSPSTCQDNEAQTEAVLDPAFANVMPSMQTQDSETQTDVVLDS